MRPCSTDLSLVFSPLYALEIIISPVTSNAERGLVVPIPMLPLSIATLLPITSPENAKPEITA